MGVLVAVIVKLNSEPTVPAAVSGAFVMTGVAVVTVSVTVSLGTEPARLVTTDDVEAAFAPLVAHRGGAAGDDGEGGVRAGDGALRRGLSGDDESGDARGVETLAQHIGSEGAAGLGRL